MSAKKFFKENIAHVPQSDLIEWNTQRGLLALAEQLEEIQQQQANQDFLLRTIATALQRSGIR